MITERISSSSMGDVDGLNGIGSCVDQADVNVTGKESIHYE